MVISMIREKFNNLITGNYKKRQEEKANATSERKRKLEEQQDSIKLDSNEQTQKIIADEVSDILITDKSIYYRNEDSSKNRTFNIKDIIDIKQKQRLSTYAVKTNLAITAIIVVLALFTNNVTYGFWINGTVPLFRWTLIFWTLLIITTIIGIVIIRDTCKREKELYVRFKYKKGSYKIQIENQEIIKELQDIILVCQR